MSRFTDPNKWHKDKWFRNLEPLQKLIFLYLIDNCDIAGFWEVDFDMMAYSIGVSEEELIGAYKGLDKGIIECNGWIWIRKFIKHQKNLPLNPKNNAHKGIIRILKLQSKRFVESQEFNEFMIDNGIKNVQKRGASEGLNSPTGKGKGKVNNIDKEDTEEFTKPTVGECSDWLVEKKDISRIKATRIAENFYNFYESKNWKVGKNDMSSWPHALSGSLEWEKNKAIMDSNDGNNNFKSKIV